MDKNDKSGAINEIEALEKEIFEKKEKLAELKRSLPKQEIRDYDLLAHDGSTVSLSSLFGDKNQLILVHNMGKGCRYCTLWADGFNGIRHHMQNRAAFVVVSPDTPEVQKAFADSRGWEFAMYSCKGSTLASDLDFYVEGSGYYPGVSALEKSTDGRVYRTAKAYFGPGDDFCSVWHFLNLLSDGANGWEPQYSY